MKQNKKKTGTIKLNIFPENKIKKMKIPDTCLVEHVTREHCF